MCVAEKKVQMKVKSAKLAFSKLSGTCLERDINFLLDWPCVCAGENTLVVRVVHEALDECSFTWRLRIVSCQT